VYDFECKKLIFGYNFYPFSAFNLLYPSYNPSIGIKINAMKTKNLLTVLAVTIMLLNFTSCKKENAVIVTSEEKETTIELGTGQAVADNITEDANEAFMEAAANKNLLGNNLNNQTITTSNMLSCAAVTVTPVSGFPKTIVIDFGTGNCTSSNGVIRKGKINIVLSDSVRKAGSTAVITFTNFYVYGFKKEGTVTWTNTSTVTTKGWQRKVENGKITAPDGRYWLHSGTRDAVQIAGTTTPNTLLDDIFLITGNHTVTNSVGKTRNCYITEALQKKTVCENIGSGKLKIEGNNHNAFIDFGDGTCDKVATISIDGNTPITIQLR
jgi:hypothetical protein